MTTIYSDILSCIFVRI